MIKPVRLQLSRKKGFSLQGLSREVNGLEAVNVARPSRWGNPFTAEGCRAAGFSGDDEAIATRVIGAFSAWLTSPYWKTNWQGPESEKARKAILDNIGALGGYNLACWCRLDVPCHASVLLELANPPPTLPGEPL